MPDDPEPVNDGGVRRLRPRGERMGCSEGTVKSQLSRAPERLREHARLHAPLQTKHGKG